MFFVSAQIETPTIVSNSSFSRRYQAKDTFGTWERQSCTRSRGRTARVHGPRGFAARAVDAAVLPSSLCRIAYILPVVANESRSTVLPWRRVGPTRSEPVECSSACKDKELGAWALEQQGRVIDEWRSGRGSFAFAGQPVVNHPAAFRWHASSKKNRPSWCLYPSRMATVLPLRTAWIAVGYPFASVPARCTKTTLLENVVAETGRDLFFGTTARLSDLSMPLIGQVRRSPEPSARP